MSYSNDELDKHKFHKFILLIGSNQHINFLRHGLKPVYDDHHANGLILEPFKVTISHLEGLRKGGFI